MVFLLLALTWGALVTPDIPSSSSSSSSGFWRCSISNPPGCLILPCRGSNRFLFRILVLPLQHTLPCTWEYQGRLTCYLVFITLPPVLYFMFAFPGSFSISSSTPLHLWSYRLLCLACCLLATCLAFLWAKLSLLFSCVTCGLTRGNLFISPF